MNSIEVPVLSNRDQQNNGSLSTSPLFDMTTALSLSPLQFLTVGVSRGKIKITPYYYKL